MALGFAGSVDLADAAFAAVDLDGPADQVAADLRPFTGGIGNGVPDFLVGSTDGRLRKVADGAVEEVITGAIGSPAAYRMYQGIMQGAIPNPFLPKLRAVQRASDELLAESMMHVAFRQVIESQHFDDVGDFQVGATLIERGEFHYDIHAESSFERPVVMRLHAEWQPLAGGGVQEGGFTMSVTQGVDTRSASGCRVPLIHFGYANFGFLYVPDRGRVIPRPRRIPGDAPAFYEACREQYGIVV